MELINGLLRSGRVVQHPKRIDQIERTAPKRQIFGVAVRESTLALGILKSVAGNLNARKIIIEADILISSEFPLQSIHPDAAPYFEHPLSGMFVEPYSLAQKGSVEIGMNLEPFLARLFKKGV